MLAAHQGNNAFRIKAEQGVPTNEVLQIVEVFDGGFTSANTTGEGDDIIFSQAIVRIELDLGAHASA